MKIFGLAMVAVLGAACLWGCGVREETGKPMLTITVATYNLDHFSTETILAESGRKITSPGATRAAAIHQINADILILQEVKTGPQLSEFNRSELADMGYKYVAVDAASDTEGFTLAVLSRFPIVNKVSHKDVPLDPALKGAEAGGPSNHFARDLYRVDVRCPGGSVVAIYDVHLKSTSDFKDDPGSAKWRLREAQAIVRIVKQENDLSNVRPSKEFVIAGDFNDGPESQTVQAIQDGFHPPLLDVLAMWGRTGSTIDKQPNMPRVTFSYGKAQAAVDTIFLSGSFGGLGSIQDSPEIDIAGSHRPVVTHLVR